VAKKEQQLQKVIRLVNKQRWVYCTAPGVYAISETPIPYKDAISVYCTGCRLSVQWSTIIVRRH